MNEYENTPSQENANPQPTEATQNASWQPAEAPISQHASWQPVETSQEDRYTYYAGNPGVTPAPSWVPEPKKKRPRWIAVVALVLCCSVLSALCGAGGVMLMQNLQEEEQKETTNTPEEQVSQLLQGNRENTVLEIVEIDTGKLMTPAEVYAANVRSTVGITTSITTTFWGYQSTSAASGSGFIISADGYILTNYHVIEDSNSICVSMYDGDSYDAKLIGYDESNDIAVLKIEAEGLSPVILGDSDNLNVGDSVVAIGNPLGELTFTLTTGAVSAKDREVTFSGNITMNLLQTDCAINSGNSGGALFNLYGEVIGVTNAKYSSSSSGASIDNIGFAIPINSVMHIVESIIEKGYVSKPYLGISVLDVSEESQQYGVPAGVAIREVAENSPAAKAGLRRGDVITAVDGVAMTSNELVRFVSQVAVGQQLTFTVYRQGTVLEVTVDVGEQIQTAPEQEQTQTNPESNFPWGGNR